MEFDILYFIILAIKNNKITIIIKILPFNKPPSSSAINLKIRNNSKKHNLAIIIKNSNKFKISTPIPHTLRHMLLITSSILPYNPF